MLTFDTPEDTLTVTPERLAIAGWAGRDQAGVQHHIDELAAIGVKPPSSVPLFYRASAQLLTQAENVEMLGSEGSGEAEVCLVSDGDGRLWVTVYGSASRPITPTANSKPSAWPNPSSSAPNRSPPRHGR